MFRLAVLADIHGNLPALDAVLDNIQNKHPPDEIWVLGDLVAFFPWLTETITRLRSLPNLRCLMGNTDRYLVTGQRHTIPVHSPQDWQNIPVSLKLRDESFRWMTEHLSYEDFLFLRDLPNQLERMLEGFGRILAVHGSPGSDEKGMHPETPDPVIQNHLPDPEPRLLLAGHTHISFERKLDETLLVNPGSVGFPSGSVPRAAYAFLEIKGRSCQVELIQVEYLLETIVQKLEDSSYPGATGMIRKLRSSPPPTGINLATSAKKE